MERFMCLIVQKDIHYILYIEHIFSVNKTVDDYSSCSYKKRIRGS